MNLLPRIIPWCIVAIAALCFALLVFPGREPDDKMQVSRFGEVPVLDKGRFKPFDTYARTLLVFVSNRQTYKDADGTSQPAVRWLLDTMAAGLAGYYEEFQFVQITNPEVLKFLGLEANPRGFYAVQDVLDKPQFKKELDRIVKGNKQDASAFDRDLFALAMQVVRCMERGRTGQAIQDELARRKTEQAPVFRIENDQVLAMLALPRREGLRYSLAELRRAKGFEQFEKKAKEVDKRPEKEWDLVDAKTMELYRHLQTYLQLQTLGGVLMVPPPSAAPEEDWQLLGRSLAQGDMSGASNPNALALESLLRAYGTGDAATFNKELAAYQEQMEKQYPEESRLARSEVVFNHFAPFYWCMYFYVLVSLLVLASWVVLLATGSPTWTGCLNRSAFWLLVLTFAVHTGALIWRMVLQGRPPVTNLYSSAVFIGWGAVGLGLLLECFFRLGFGSLIGAALGFLTTLISHHLALSGDTLEMMQAVLDTNFWLATHVVVVTLGYTATFVAGFLGIIYVLVGIGTPWLNRKVSDFTAPGEGGFVLERTIGKTLVQMIYGVVCFATLLSFVGTVLGGIWADQSWGRFWGWDPKENGALLIVGMNALILHARWGGLIKDRGLVVLAMAGNMVTLWSWFGTNQLGIGLHAYGFNKTLVEVCRYSWIVQAGLIGAALIPTKHWLSTQPVVGKTPAPKPGRKPHGGRGGTGISAVPS